MTVNEPDVKMKILLAAKKLFAEHGFDGTSVRQICEAAGANVALISYYFGGKDNVYFALFDAFFPTSRIEELTSYLDKPEEGIKVLITEIIAFNVADAEMSSIIQQEVMRNGPRGEKVQQYLFPYWRKLRELLEAGRQQGKFQFQSLDRAMFFVMGTVFFQKHVVFFSPLLSEHKPWTEQSIDETMQFIFSGVKKL